MVQLIRDVRGPEATQVAVEDVPFDRLTEPGRPARRVRLPSGREGERAAKGDVGLNGWLLQPDDVALGSFDDPSRLPVHGLEMRHSAASAFASSRSNRARN